MPGRARSARRPCASSSRAPSAAAARRDTTCPGRNAATAPLREAVGEPAEQHARPAAASSGPSASVFHSAPSMSSIDTKVGSPPMVSRGRRWRCRARSPAPTPEQRLPLRVGVGLGGARRLADARHRHVVARTRPRSFSTAPSIGAALDGSGVQASGMWPSPVEQARGRIEPDPAGARQIDLAPGVQVGEVVRRTLGPVERLLVGHELDQVARDEARGEAEMAQDAAPAASRCRGTSPWRARASARRSARRARGARCSRSPSAGARSGRRGSRSVRGLPMRSTLASHACEQRTTAARACETARSPRRSDGS